MLHAQPRRGSENDHGTRILFALVLHESFANVCGRTCLLIIPDDPLHRRSEVVEHDLRVIVVLLHDVAYVPDALQTVL